MNAFRINLNFKFPRYGTSARGIADEGKALPLSPKLAKMLKSLSVLASRCNVRVDTRFRGRKRRGFRRREFGLYPFGAIRVMIIGGKLLIIVHSHFPHWSRVDYISNRKFWNFRKLRKGNLLLSYYKREFSPRIVCPAMILLFFFLLLLFLNLRKKILSRKGKNS